jgi:YggT family protein
MFVLRQLLIAVSDLLYFVLQAYMWIIIIRALVSWVNPDPWNPIVQFLYRVTEPVLRPIRRRIPMSGIDVSPIIVILAIYFMQWFLVPVIREAAFRLG